MNLYYRLGSNLYINVTNLCPCDCVFCIRGHTDGVGTAKSLWLEREPTIEELKKTFEQRIEQDTEPISEIVFCGFGEPLERADVVCELAVFIKSKCSHPIRLNTNGLVNLINSDFDIAGLSVFNLISISLNADTKEEYLRVARPRFGIESFDVMLSFAKEVQNITRVQFTIVESLDKKRQKKCREIADRMGIPLIIRSMM